MPPPFAHDHDTLLCSRGVAPRYDGVECPEEKLELECVVESTIETFMPEDFRKRLAGFVGLSEEQVEVKAAAASLVVTATIVANQGGGAAGTSLKAVRERLQTLTAATASGVLGVRVLSIAPVRTVSDATATNKAAMATVRAEVSTAASRAAAVITIAIVMVFAAMALVASVICCDRIQRNRHATSHAKSISSLTSAKSSHSRAKQPTVMSRAGSRTLLRTGGLLSSSKKLTRTMSAKDPRRSHRESWQEEEEEDGSALGAAEQDDGRVGRKEMALSEDLTAQHASPGSKMEDQTAPARVPSSQLHAWRKRAARRGIDPERAADSAAGASRAAYHLPAAMRLPSPQMGAPERKGCSVRSGTIDRPPSMRIVPMSRRASCGASTESSTRGASVLATEGSVSHGRVDDDGAGIGLSDDATVDISTTATFLPLATRPFATEAHAVAPTAAVSAETLHVERHEDEGWLEPLPVLETAFETLPEGGGLKTEAIPAVFPSRQPSACNIALDGARMAAARARAAAGAAHEHAILSDDGADASSAAQAHAKTKDRPIVFV